MARFLRLFTVCSLLVFVVGAGLYFWRHQTFASGVKSVDAYWQDTGLESQTLEDILSSPLCHSSEKHFLACINALNSVAQQVNLFLQPDGQLSSLNLQKMELSEKELLQSWMEKYRQDIQWAAGFNFYQLWSRIKAHLSADNETKAVASGLNGFLSVLRDPHTYLIPLDYYTNVLAIANSKVNVLGLTLARNSGSGLYYVRRVLNKSLAEKVGFKKGDLVHSINDTQIAKLSLNAVSELMKGPEGTRLHFEIERSGLISHIRFVKKAVAIPTATGQIYDREKGLGVLSLNRFARNTCEETKEVLKGLVANGLKALLLDLRDNPGGQMEEAACVASLFLGPDKKIFEIKYLDEAKETESYFGSEDVVFEGSVGVLVNRGSASAAEIVAGALRDYNRAILIGERTFGKGSFQEGEVWSQNKKIALFETKGFYYLPSGKSPQIKGLLPDVRVQFKDLTAKREGEQYLNPLEAPQHLGWVVSQPYLFPRNCDLIRLESADNDNEIAQKSLNCAMASQSVE